MEIIGRAIDINEHLISQIAHPNMEAPKTYRATFLLLGDLNILQKDFAEEIARSAGRGNGLHRQYLQGQIFRRRGATASWFPSTEGCKEGIADCEKSCQASEVKKLIF